jgi:hypothetical protein
LVAALLSRLGEIVARLGIAESQQFGVEAIKLLLERREELATFGRFAFLGCGFE